MSNFTQPVSNFAGEHFNMSFMHRILEMSEDKTIFIGVAGGSASGKTTFSKWLVKHFSHIDCGLVLQDSYYKDLSNKFDADGGSINFDHPSSIDFDLLLQHLQQLQKGLNVAMPTYDFKTHKRTTVTELIQPKRVIIVDGILVLHDEGLKNFFDLSFFIKTPESLRFSRRLSRDVKERGRTEEGVKKQFALQVKPMHDLFVEPSQSAADYVLLATLLLTKIFLIKSGQ